MRKLQFLLIFILIFFLSFVVFPKRLNAHSELVNSAGSTESTVGQGIADRMPPERDPYEVIPVTPYVSDNNGPGWPIIKTGDPVDPVVVSSAPDPFGAPRQTPGPEPTCYARPACLDANPRCLIAEPADGWCPAGSADDSRTIPQPTSAHEKPESMPEITPYLPKFPVIENFPAGKVRLNSSLWKCGKIDPYQGDFSVCRSRFLLDPFFEDRSPESCSTFQTDASGKSEANLQAGFYRVMPPAGTFCPPGRFCIMSGAGDQVSSLLYPSVSWHLDPPKFYLPPFGTAEVNVIGFTAFSSCPANL